MSLQALREKHMAKVEAAQQFYDENKGSWTRDKGQKFDALVSDAEDAKSSIAAYERAMNMAPFEGSHEGPGGYGPGTSDSRGIFNALGEYVRTGNAATMGFRAGLTTTGSDGGGVIVPREIASEILRVQKNFSPLRTICRVLSTETAHSKFTQPVHTGTGAGSWVGETDARPTTTEPTLVEVTFPDAECYVNIPVSAWWESDSQAGAWLLETIARELARIEGASFINGTGTKQPKGFLAHPTAATADEGRAFGTIQHLQGATGQTATVTPDDLVKLLYLLKPEYRANASWVMNSATLSKVRQLKDSQNRFLWDASIAAGQPSTLLGYPVLECNDMSDMAANALAIAVGDFGRAYTILDRSLTLLRDPYSNKPYVNFYCTKRVSGEVTDSNAIKLYKNSAT